jgi:pentafunctional AROM polypeptide
MDLGRVKRYFLFGSPIQGSPSPTLHNTGFQVCEQRDGVDMNSHYSICDSLDINKVKRVIASPSFGGASVTIPHKQAVIPFMNRLTDAAKAINAVNTVVVSRDRTNPHVRELIGDNTDWIGIRNLLLQHDKLKARDPEAVALVIGAGGTALAACYCATQLGMKLRVYNRTYEKAAEVAERFGGEVVRQIDETSLPRVDVVIGTVPATSGFVLPTAWLVKVGGEHGMPVVVDVAYKPRQVCT